MTGIPNPEPHCGSWIIISRATGKPVFETFERRTAETVNRRNYEVLTAAQWLARFNRSGGVMTSSYILAASRAAALPIAVFHNECGIWHVTDPRGGSYHVCFTADNATRAYRQLRAKLLDPACVALLEREI